MEMRRGSWLEKGNRVIYRLDSMPLWWVGFIMLAIVALPHLALGKGSVFPLHDQLDEELMTYVLTARHLGQETFPEMMGGINCDGMQPAALLFVLPYCFLTPFQAFTCSYFVLFTCGFLGMYLAVRELTESNVLALLSAGCFCMLPLYTIYGLSEIGIPLLLYAFLCLYRGKRTVGAYVMIGCYGLASSLVYTGYVALGLWLLVIFIRLFRREKVKRLLVGFLELLSIYVITNAGMFVNVILKRGGYVSHREEMVTSSRPFAETVIDLFVNGHFHANACHTRLILPILILLIFHGIRYKKLREDARRRYRMAAFGMAALLAVALFYGFCALEPVVAWKNRISGFLHYFQMDRLYWFYPAGWYLELAMAFSVGWTEGRSLARDGVTRFWRSMLLQCVILAAAYPAADEILHESVFYQNVNQYNNGSDITGYVSWESFYAEDVMQEIDDAIGRDKGTYRVAHLGISPAPALMHGFYTVDGYSGNYSLEYKHAFRRVIAAELDRNPEAAVYFDTWGNRCYLFNSVTGTYWMLKKGNAVRYEGLQFDMEALAGLGCEYILSGAEIVDAQSMGLELMGYFESETSYWGIWLYAYGK